MKKENKAEDTLLEIKHLLYDDSGSSNVINLDNVIKKFRKYLYLKDTKMLETILGVILSNQIEGSPIWIIFCGSSGDAKSTQLLSIVNLSNIILLDQLTKNTLASGNPKFKDLGSRLQNSSHIILIPDLACISAKYKDDRKEIFASMRNLYDGFIKKNTGMNEREYHNCHVTLLAGSTLILKKEYLIHQQLGSRELIFDTDAIIEDADIKMDKSWENEEYEKEMKQELSNVVKDYIDGREVKRIEIVDDIKNFLKAQAKRLAILRAVGDYNQYSDELEADMYVEVPTRLIKQFKRLWICIKSLDDDYPDERTKDIIRHIVKSSGNANRLKILDILKNKPDEEYTINDLKHETKLGYRVCKRELEALWNLGIIEKERMHISKSNKVYDMASYHFNEEMWLELVGS